MAIEIFSRYEGKYLISEIMFDKLQRRLSQFMDIDCFNEQQFTYPVCNIYYDTPDSRVIRASLAKPEYKEKLRLRSYGTPGDGSTVYAEIKKKYKDKVNKRRSGLKLNEAYAFFSTGRLPVFQPYMNAQVLRETQFILSQTPLKPAVYIAYERRALKNDEGLRLTFDTDIVTRRTDLQLESGVYGSPLLPKGVWLMEAKTPHSLPVWLSHLLAEYKVYPDNFSKYGAEYQQALREGKLGNAGVKRIFVIMPQQPAGSADAGGAAAIEKGGRKNARYA